MDMGEEKIHDDALAAGLRAKAKAVHRRALLVAVAVTVVVLIFPEG